MKWRVFAFLEVRKILRFRVFILLILIGASVQGAEWTRLEFSSDFGGASNDSLNLYQGYPDTLSLYRMRRDFMSLYSSHLNDSAGGKNRYGSYPVVFMPGVNVLDVIWNSWDVPHGASVDEIDSLMFRRYDLGSLQASYTEWSIAGGESPGDTNYYSGLTQRYPPNSVNLLTALNGDYLATWGTVTFGPVRTTNSVRLTSILNPLNRGENFDTVTTLTQFGGNPSVDFIPRGATAEQLVVYGLQAKNGSNFTQAVLQRESFPGRTPVARDTFTAVSGTNVFMKSFQVATDSTGRSLVAWIEGNDIYARVFDLGLNDLSTGLQVTSSGDVEIRNPITELHSPFIGLANTVNGQFVITYGRLGNIYYRLINAQTLSVGAEQLLAGGSASHWPSVATAGDKIAFAYFGDLVSGTDRAHVSRFDLDGLGAPMGATRADTALVNFNTTFTHSYGMRVHSWGQIQLAIDVDGNLGAAFNNEADAYLTLWGNRAYYADSSFYRSGVFEFSAPGVAEPWALGDSIYVLRTLYSQDSLLILNFTQGTGSGLTNAYAFSSLHNVDSVASQAVDGSFYRYQFSFYEGVNHRYAPVVDSLKVYWNAKPRIPRRINAQINLNAFISLDTLSLMAKRDSLLVNYEIFDYSAEDNPDFFYALANESPVQVNLGADSAGFYSYALRLTARDSSGWQPLVSWVVDSLGYKSLEDTLWIDFRNDAPTGVLQWTSADGMGNVDTSSLPQLNPLIFEGGSSARLFGVVSDSNTSTLQLSWSTRVAGVSGSLNITSGNAFAFDLTSPSADSQQVRPGLNSWLLGTDTLDVAINDSRDTTRISQLYQINHRPWAEGVSSIRYGIPWVDSAMAQSDALPGRSGAFIVPYTPTTLELQVADADSAKGDTIGVEWYLIDLDSVGTCCFNRRGPVAVGQRIDVGEIAMANDTLKIGSEIWAGAAAIKSFYDFPPLLVARSIDARGANSEDTLMLQYSIADTTLNPFFGSSLEYLQMNLHYAAGSQRLKDTVSAVIHSTGTIPLGVYKLSTVKDQGIWLDVETFRPERELMKVNTDSSRIDPNNPWQIAKGDSIRIRFLIDVDSLRGDYLFVDTLYVETNDFLNPRLPLPFRLKVSDMPIVDYYYHTLGGWQETDSLIGKSIPLWSEVLLVFNEPVLKDSINSSLEIYSVLDSVVRAPNSHDAIPPYYSGLWSMNTFRKSDGTTMNGYTDSVRFAPEYLAISDSLKKRPPAGVWIPRDLIRLKINNGIVDSAGNPLDLSRQREVADAGSLDTLLSFYIDSATLQVDTANSYPKEGVGFDADRDIEIRFNAPLSWINVFGKDTLVAIDTLGMGEGQALGVALTSAKSGGRALPLRSIELRSGDSVLFVRPLRRFFADDTVTLRLDSRISDQWGRTLDGNFDGEGEHLFGFNDSLDFFEITFEVADGRFYTFPNPYRAWDPSHQAIGGIRFKNLEKIKGFKKTAKWEIGFYDVTGQNLLRRTLWDPRSGELSPPQEYLWNVRNRAGKKVASGTYLYVFYANGKAVKKGKVALIR